MERGLFILNTAFGLVIMGCAMGMVIMNEACKIDMRQALQAQVSESINKSDLLQVDLSWTCKYIHDDRSASGRFPEYVVDTSGDCYAI